MSGNVWDSTIVISKTKLNQMNIISGTSAYLAGLSNVVNQVHLPQDTGNGYIAYNLFAWDGSIDRNLSNPIHDHSGDSFGGNIANIAYGNSKVIDTIKMAWFETSINNWAVTADAGCSIAEDSATNPDSILTSVGTTLNSRAYGEHHNRKIDFGFPIFFGDSVKFNTAVTSFSMIHGVNCEIVGDAPDNANKIGFEICTSVNGNYFIFAANGSTRVGTDTGVASDTTNERALAFYYTPAVNIKWKVSTGTSGTKTTGCPSSGVSTSRTQVMRTGQKTTVGSQAKSMNFWGPRLIYTAGEILQ